MYKRISLKLLNKVDIKNPLFFSNHNKSIPFSYDLITQFKHKPTRNLHTSSASLKNLHTYINTTQKTKNECQRNKMCFSGTATVDIMLEVFYLFHQIYRMCIDVLSCRLEYFAIEISGGIHKFMLYEFLYEKCFLLSNVVHHQEPLFHLFVVFHERFSFRRIILTIIGRDTLLFLFPGTRDSVDFEDILRVYIHSDHLF